MKSQLYHHIYQSIQDTQSNGQPNFPQLLRTERNNCGNVIALSERAFAAQLDAILEDYCVGIRQVLIGYSRIEEDLRQAIFS